MNISRIAQLVASVLTLALLVGCSSAKQLGSGYQIRGDSVYYTYTSTEIIPVIFISYERNREILVEGADAKTFEIIQLGYAKDAQHVFVAGRLLPGSDAATFAPIGERYYAKDAGQVYYGANVLPGADPATFELVGSGDYTKDAVQVYYGGGVITGADPATFELVGSGALARDKKDYYLRVFPLHVGSVDSFTLVGDVGDDSAIWAYDSQQYYIGDDTGDDRVLISYPIADPASFQLLTDGYAKDATQIYYMKASLAGSNPASFTVLADGYAKDAAQAYYFGKALAGADAASFEKFEDKALWRDKKDYYLWGSPLHVSDLGSFALLGKAGDDNAIWAYDAQKYYTGSRSGADGALLSYPIADPASFKLLADGYASDAKKVYYLSDVTKADPASFAVLADGYAKDAAHAYYTSEQIDGADLATFEVLGGGYAKDAKRAYHYGSLLSVDLASFVALTDGYAKDANQAYHGSDLITSADLPTFQALGGGYAKDSKQVYYQSIRLPEADAATFVVDANGARDKGHRYDGSQAIKN
jgi:hypothetical protein